MVIVVSLIYSLVGVAGAWTLFAVALQVCETRAKFVKPATRPVLKPLTALHRNWEVAKAQLQQYMRDSESAGATSTIMASFWSSSSSSMVQSASPDISAPVLINTPAKLPAVVAISRHCQDINRETEEILGFVMRDFILSWYYKAICNPRERLLTPSMNALPDHIAYQLVVIVGSMKRRLENIDFLQVFVTKIVPLLTTHLHQFRLAEQSLRGNNDDTVLTESAELHEMIASRYDHGQAGNELSQSHLPDKLHSALSNKSSTSLSELSYLRQIVNRILPILHPGAEIRNNLSRSLLREIVTCSLLKPIIDSLSQPDYWNELIDLLAGRAIRELLREALKRQSEVLTEEVDSTPDMDSLPGSLLSRQNNSVRSYESFLRLIKNCKNLLEAKRIRNHIVMEIRKRRLEIVNRQPTDVVNGIKVSESVRYINKLIVAKRRVEKRITALGGQPYRSRRLTSLRMAENALSSESLTLLHILKSSSGLSHFMEFMDQMNSTHLLQFWLMIESFRQHFEQHPSREQIYLQHQFNEMQSSLKPSSMESQNHPIVSLSNEDCKTENNTSTINNMKDTSMSKRQSAMSSVNSSSTEWPIEKTDIVPLKQDALLIYEMFLAPNASKRVLVNIETISTIEILMDSLQASMHSPVQPGLLEVNMASSSGYSGGYDFSCLFEAQDQVYDEMNKFYFPKFKRTDLYITFVSGPNFNIEISNSTVDGWQQQRPKINRPQLPKVVYPAFTSSNSATPSIPSSLASESKINRPRSTSTVSSVDTTTATSVDSVDHMSVASLKPRGSIAVVSKAYKETETPRIQDKTFLNPFSRLLSLPNTASTLMGLSTSPWFPGKRLLADSRTQTPEEALNTLTEVAAIENLDETELLKSDAVEVVEAELASIMSNDADNVTVFSTLSLLNPMDLLGKLRGQSISTQSVSSHTVIASSSNSINPAHTSTKSSASDPNNLIAKEKMLNSSNSDEPLAPSSISSSSWRSRSGSSLSLSSKVQPIDSFTHSSVSDFSTISPTPDQALMPPPTSARIRSDSASSMITHLRQELDKLAQQEAIVDTLLANARETGRNAQLVKILDKSKVALQNEIRELMWQEIQTQKQSHEALLVPGRSTVSIISSTMSNNGVKEFALYIIEVSSPALSASTASWVVARRYSEFFALHQALKAKYSSAQQYDLPKKMPNALMGYKRNFVETRREKLEKYLQNLCQHPEICNSDEFKRFLCQEPVIDPDPTESLSSPTTPLSAQGLGQCGIDMSGARRASSAFIQTFKNKIAEGLDDIFLSSTNGTGNAHAGVSLFDRVTAKLRQQLHSVSSASQPSPSMTSTFTYEDDNVSRDNSRDADTTTGPFRGKDRDKEDRSAAEPLSDLFIEIFELKDKNNWLRKQAVAIILQQILGGTIDRKVADVADFLQSDDMILWYLRSLKQAMWPNGGEFKPAGPKKTETEKTQLAEDARKKCVSLITEIFGPFVGRTNVRKGASKVFSLLQNQILNRHLLYSLLDIIVDELFP